MKGSTLFLIVFGLGIAAIGALFTALMWHSYQRATDMHAWPKVEAVILSSEIEERQQNDFSPKEYRLKLLYGYEWESVPQTGALLTLRGNPWTKEKTRALNEMKRFQLGDRLIAYVNPKNPQMAILHPDTKAAGYSIWFPLLFVVGGLGIAVRATFKRSLPLPKSNSTKAS